MKKKTLRNNIFELESGTYLKIGKNNNFIKKKYDNINLIHCAIKKNEYMSSIKKIYNKCNLFEDIKSNNIKRILFFKGYDNLSKQLYRKLLNEKYVFEIEGTNKFNKKIFQKKYDVVIILNYDKMHNKSIEKFGLIGIPVISNRKYPNCVNYYEDADYLLYLTKFIVKNYSNYKNHIIESMNSYINEQYKENIKHKLVVIIATHKRKEILRTNLNLLKLNSHVEHIVVSITDENEIDKKYENNKTVTYCITKNQPLGEKWHHGVLVSKIFLPKYIIIMGSDDFIFPNFFEEIFKKHKNFDLYIHNLWIIYDIANNKFYKVKYKSSKNGLGSGRIIRADFLDKIDWLFYPINRSIGLDHNSNKKIKENNGHVMVGGDEKSLILCPKYNVECMNSMNDIINNMNFDVETINIKECYQKYIKLIKNSVIEQSKIQTNKKYNVINSYQIDLDHNNISVTTSLVELKMMSKLELKCAKLIIKEYKGTPGIYIKCNYLKNDKNYKLTVKHNYHYKLFTFLVNKNKNEQFISYNKNCIKDGVAFFDTHDIKRFNMLAICTGNPIKGVIEFYKIVISEIEYV